MGGQDKDNPILSAACTVDNATLSDKLEKVFNQDFLEKTREKPGLSL